MSAKTKAPAGQYALIDAVPRGRDRLLYVTLQGLVNRAGPRLYLVADEETDAHWVDWYRKYDLEPDRLTLDEAIARFLPELRGAYVLGGQDPEWEVPLAVTLAGVEDRLVATAEQAERLRQLGVTCDPVPVPRFHGRLEAMAWAYTNLRPRTKPELLHANRLAGTNTDIVDWLVAERGFSFALTTNPESRPGERALLHEIYRNTPLEGWVFGWHQKDDGECSHIDFASRHGLIPFCMINNLNFSFHRHVPAKQPWHHPAPADPPALDANKCYLTFVFSDGDAPHSMADLQKRQWNKPERGNFPFGWAVPPEMVTFGPAMLEYYYHTRTGQDELMCGPSGLGYTYLSRWAEWRNDGTDRQAARQGYLHRSNALMKELDLSMAWPINRLVHWSPEGVRMHRIGGDQAWLMNADRNPATYGLDFMDDELIHDYCTHMPASIGFFQGWSAIPNEPERHINGRPYFPAKVLASKPEPTLQAIDRLAAMEGAPCFIPVHVNCYAMGVAGVEQTIARLDRSRYEVLLPSAFLRMAQQAHEASAHSSVGATR